jgi:hypothetical protein
MGKKLLHESTATPLKREGGRWKATLLTPGQGSSAFYSEEALRSSVDAFGNGTKNFFKHPEKPGDQRDPRDQWGVIPESVSYEDGVGIVAEIEILPHWKAVIDSLAEAGQASLSIWAMGETDEEGNLLALSPDVQNTVDLVAFPGRPGSGLTEKMYESAIAFSETDTGVTSAQEEKEGNMEKVLEAIAALDAKFVAFVTESLAAATANVKAEADADAVEKAVESAVATYDEKVVAIEAAKLFPSQAEAIRAEAVKGADIAPLIEAAKLVFAEATAAAAGEEEIVVGRHIETVKATASDLIPKGW